MAKSSKDLETLNPTLRCCEVDDVEQEILSKVIGQDYAVDKVVKSYQIFHSGLNAENRPIAVFLFLGPTGTGKTYLTETAAEVITRKNNSILKINCAEFQDSHEISKLIGSPPGYVGHKDTVPIFSQENVNAQPFILFDEIEKANETMRKLMLGILDKGVVMLGNNKTTYFSNTFVFMTSNLGSKEMENALKPQLGFTSPTNESDDTDIKKKTIIKVGIDALSKNFSPEFINRLDEVVVFNSLTQENLYKILDQELLKIRKRLLCASEYNNFIFNIDANAKKFLIDSGYNTKFGARHLTRVLQKLIVFPLAALISTKQITCGDRIHIEYKEGNKHLTFKKEKKKPEPVILIKPRGEPTL